MAVPAKTFDFVGPATMQAARRYDAHEFYALSGNDLNDLAVLAVRLNDAMRGEELRDWQNRINLMLSNATVAIDRNADE